MTKQSDQLNTRLRLETANVIRAIILRIDSNLRAHPDRGGTPVDTGHARANWVPSVSVAFVGQASGDGAHDQGVARVLAYRLEDGPAWLTNNVPYVLRLNDGHSKQAPRGFIETAIREAQDWANKQYGQSIRVDTVEGFGTQLAGNIAVSFRPGGVP